MALTLWFSLGTLERPWNAKFARQLAWNQVNRKAGNSDTCCQGGAASEVSRPWLRSLTVVRAVCTAMIRITGQVCFTNTLAKYWANPHPPSPAATYRGRLAYHAMLHINSLEGPSIVLSSACFLMTRSFRVFIWFLLFYPSAELYHYDTSAPDFVNVIIPAVIDTCIFK